MTSKTRFRLILVLVSSVLSRCGLLAADPSQSSGLAAVSPQSARPTDVVASGSISDAQVRMNALRVAVQALGEHWSGQATDWSGLPDMAAPVLPNAAPVVADLASAFAGVRVVDVVASGASASTAGEGALMLRESARLLTASHETHNYLHGPMEPLDPQTACVIAGDGREVRLALETSELGCPTLLITTRSDISSSKTLTVLTMPRASSPLAQAVLEILPLQQLAWAVASDRGLAVDGFRYHQDDTKLS